MKPLDDAYIRLLDHFLGSEICLSPFQVSRITCPVFSTNIKFKLKYFLVMLTTYFVSLSSNNCTNLYEEVSFNCGSSKIDRRLILCQSKPTKNISGFLWNCKNKQRFLLFLRSSWSKPFPGCRIWLVFSDWPFY